MYNSKKYEPTIFRSYDHEQKSASTRGSLRSPGPADDIDLWKVARATSSRPNYFAPIEIGDVRYEDGGLLSRNPSFEIMREVVDLNGADWSPIDCLVSLGSGVPKRDDTRKATIKQKWITEWLQAKRERQEDLAAHDSDTGHDITWRLMYSQRKAYWRLDGRIDMGNLPLEDIDMDSSFEDLTRKLGLDDETSIDMESDYMAQKLSNCARRLVAKRHAQSQS